MAKARKKTPTVDLFGASKSKMAAQKIQGGLDAGDTLADLVAPTSKAPLSARAPRKPIPGEEAMIRKGVKLGQANQTLLSAGNSGTFVQELRGKGLRAPSIERIIRQANKRLSNRGITEIVGDKTQTVARTGTGRKLAGKAQIREHTRLVKKGKNRGALLIFDVDDPIVQSMRKRGIAMGSIKEAFGTANQELSAAGLTAKVKETAPTTTKKSTTKKSTTKKTGTKVLRTPEQRTADWLEKVKKTGRNRGVQHSGAELEKQVARLVKNGFPEKAARALIAVANTQLAAEGIGGSPPDKPRAPADAGAADEGKDRGRKKRGKKVVGKKAARKAARVAAAAASGSGLALEAEVTAAATAAAAETAAGEAVLAGEVGTTAGSVAKARISGSAITTRIAQLPKSSQSLVNAALLMMANGADAADLTRASTQLGQIITEADLTSEFAARGDLIRNKLARGGAGLSPAERQLADFIGDPRTELARQRTLQVGGRGFAEGAGLGGRRALPPGSAGGPIERALPTVEGRAQVAPDDFESGGRRKVQNLGRTGAGREFIGPRGVGTARVTELGGKAVTAGKTVAKRALFGVPFLGEALLALEAGFLIDKGTRRAHNEQQEAFALFGQLGLQSSAEQTELNRQESISRTLDELENLKRRTQTQVAGQVAMSDAILQQIVETAQPTLSRIAFETRPGSTEIAATMSALLR